MVGRSKSRATRRRCLIPSSLPQSFGPFITVLYDDTDDPFSPTAYASRLQTHSGAAVILARYSAPPSAKLPSLLRWKDVCTPLGSKTGSPTLSMSLSQGDEERVPEPDPALERSPTPQKIRRTTHVSTSKKRKLKEVGLVMPDEADLSMECVLEAVKDYKRARAGRAEDATANDTLEWGLSPLRGLSRESRRGARGHAGGFGGRRRRVPRLSQPVQRSESCSYTGGGSPTMTGRKGSNPGPTTAPTPFRYCIRRWTSMTKLMWAPGGLSRRSRVDSPTLLPPRSLTGSTSA
ncbi:hypothetical protein DENSPDRAFT_590270 [Dentipellis sp. KUC8613]|nr:hypothetical protein DENSPDRAFT_590270 [Dentipellis sp. KUC8613]